MRLRTMVVSWTSRGYSAGLTENGEINHDTIHVVVHVGFENSLLDVCSLCLLGNIPNGDQFKLDIDLFTRLFGALRV